MSGVEERIRGNELSECARLTNGWRCPWRLPTTRAARIDEQFRLPKRQLQWRLASDAATQVERGSAAVNQLFIMSGPYC